LGTNLGPGFGLFIPGLDWKSLMNDEPSGNGLPSDPWLETLRRALIHNEFPAAWPTDSPSAGEWKLLVKELLDVREFILGLANGDLSMQMPAKGLLSGSLKALQASLRHLNLQVQQVADGDLSQKVDFMGEFSSAFNAMTVSLETARRELHTSEERYRRLVDADPDAITILDLSCQLMFISPNGLKMFGYGSQEELLGVSLLEWTVPHDRAFLQEQLAYSGLGEKLGSFKVNFLRRNNSVFPGEVFVTAINDDNGNPAAVIAVIHNISDRVRREEELHEQRALAEALRDSAAALNSAKSLDQVLDVILSSLCTVVPHDAADIRLLEQNDSVHAARFSTYERLTAEQESELTLKEYTLAQFANLRSMAQTHQPLRIDDVQTAEWNPLPNLEWIRSYLGAPIIIDEQVVGFISLHSEETGYFRADHVDRLTTFANQAAVAIQKARLFEDLHRLAITDGLTGLWNRRYFFTRAEQEFLQTDGASAPFSLLILDVDHFKLVNDSHGHIAGDQILAELAQICLHSLRKSDLLARYGGEEFVFLLPNTSLEEAMIVSERLLAAIAQNQFDTSAGPLQVTASIGMAWREEPLDRLEEMLDQADQALYLAKQAGRNQIQVFAE
jgi:diguanylate cyclase (GGDEF)-like protein/PAS domain S-box-containing protein